MLSKDLFSNLMSFLCSFFISYPGIPRFSFLLCLSLTPVKWGRAAAQHKLDAKTAPNGSHVPFSCQLDHRRDFVLAIVFQVVWRVEMEERGGEEKELVVENVFIEDWVVEYLNTGRWKIIGWNLGYRSFILEIEEKVVEGWATESLWRVSMKRVIHPNPNRSTFVFIPVIPSNKPHYWLWQVFIKIVSSISHV